MGESIPPEPRSTEADVDPDALRRAIDSALRVADPWEACLDFAICARFAPEGQLESLIALSFDRAAAGKDAYQRLARTAWPLRALLERGHISEAKRQFARVADIAAEVRPPSSRAEACFLVWQAVGINDDLARQALSWVLQHCRPIEHWRQSRIIRDTLVQAVTAGVVTRSDAVALVNDEKISAQLNRAFDRGETHSFRRFFWRNR